MSRLKDLSFRGRKKDTGPGLYSWHQAKEHGGISHEKLRLPIVAPVPSLPSRLYRM
jgi:hypothetical protein